MKNRFFLLMLAFLLLALNLPKAGSALENSPAGIPESSYEVDVETFDDMVTVGDMSVTHFAGTLGVINDQFGGISLICTTTTTCALRFDWNFGMQTDAFTGIFMSLFGPIESKVTYDGSTTETISYPEHSLDLDNVDDGLNSPQGVRAYLQLCFAATYSDTDSVQLRLELKDVNNGVRFTRKTLTASGAAQTVCWDFRNSAEYTVPGGSQDLDIHQAKQFVIVVERQNIADMVDNPASATIDLHRIWFISDTAEIEPATDEAYLELMALRSYQYFYDWSSRKEASFGIPWDRSTFGDLLSVGGLGFALPAHITAVERGWIERAEAANLIVRVLRTLDDPNLYCPDPIGCIGYKGWLYHFLGPDGRRKINYDFDTTPGIDESQNTVELSAIDTGLAMMGILASQSYFRDPTDPVETEIRQRAQSIYDRVEWDFLLEPTTNTFYLGWKPDEPRFSEPAFEISDGSGLGFYSGNPGFPATIDYYTDEGLILILLATGSPTHPLPPDIYSAIIRAQSTTGLTRTFPGALFTYQFFHAFIDTAHFLPACPGEDDINWYENSRQAIWEAIDYAEHNPPYGSDSWGISASEKPFDNYEANGVPSLAIDSAPPFDGTSTYYAMISAVSYGPDLKGRALSALKAAWARGHWHPRFGLPDAFHEDITVVDVPPGLTPLRSEGPWIQRALFAIDQGPMLLHLENERSSLIWRLLGTNKNIRRGKHHLDGWAQLTLQAEDGSGDGAVSIRNTAAFETSILLQAGESRTFSFNAPNPTDYLVQVRYSNDTGGTGETVEIFLDGSSLGEFEAADTGDGGFGWNVFTYSGSKLALNDLTGGAHEITLEVSGGDGFGVEVDYIQLTFPYQCRFIPIVQK